MSTTTVTPTPAVGKTTTERFDVAYGFESKVDKEGNPVLDKTGVQVKEAVVITPEAATELDKKNLFVGTVVTVSVDYPSTFDGLVDLATTPAKDDDGNVRDQKEVQAELVKLFVNGAKSKVTNRMRSLLTKTDDKGNLTFKEPDGGILDLTAEITSGSKRIFLTEEQKMWKSLAMLSGDIKTSVWKAYLTGIGKDYYVPAE